MTPRDLLENAIDPACALLRGHGIPSEDNARVLMLAIAGQESDWAARLQGGGGPARSFWQFERGGGVAAVLGSTPAQIKSVCDWLIIPCDSFHIFEAMAWNDFLAAAMTRLNLWRDPHLLPAFGDVEGGWIYYKRVWAPGLPRPLDWPPNYQKAMAILREKSLAHA